MPVAQFSCFCLSYLRPVLALGYCRFLRSCVCLRVSQITAQSQISAPWWRHQMEKKFRVTGHLCGEFTGQLWIPRTKASDAELWCFFDLHPNKRLSKQWWGWWFETLSRPLWRHCNAHILIWIAECISAFNVALVTHICICKILRVLVLVFCGCKPVKLPWVFPGAPLILIGLPEISRVTLTGILSEMN